MRVRLSKLLLKKTNKQTKKWRIQDIDFLSLKSSSPGQVLESSNSRRYHWIFKLFVANLKNRGPRAKFCVPFYHFNFERNYDVLKSKRSCFLLNKNINFHKNQTELKMENPKHILERWTLRFRSYNSCELQVNQWRVGVR